MSNFFRLPDNLADLPPPAAERLEVARRAVLDWLMAHDYELLIPPLAEYAESLSADDKDLQLDIFQMTDTLSGRTLGIRADHTPQIARFDAFAGGDKNAVRRLCYCGPALRTRPPQPWKQREVMQIGAEIFNAPVPAGDWEVVRLAVGALLAAGMKNIAIDLGHAGVLGRLLHDFSAEARAAVCRHLARQDSAAVSAKAGEVAIKLNALARLHGGCDVIAEARALLPECADLFAELMFVADKLRCENFDVGINFSEVGGYGYHTGVVFSLHGDNFIAARGGRYDRPDFRAAAGFSMDLREIVEHLPPLSLPAPISCPLDDSPAWRAAVEALRQQKRRLRFVLNTADAVPPILEKHGDEWKVRES